MKSLEYYKGRLEDAAEEGLMHEPRSKNWAELIGGLGQKGKYQKMVSLMRIIKELAPDMVSEKILDMIPKDDPSRLPFNPDKLEFWGQVGKGGEHKVFLLESNDSDAPSYVLKINQQNLGNLDQIQKGAVEFRKEYEEIKERYSSVPGIVPDELTMIVSGLRNDKPIMATVQKFYGGQIGDLVKDFNREELAELLGREPELFDKFKRFYEITKKEYDEKGIAIDLLGNKNLSIVEAKDRPRLVILDPHSSVLKVSGDKRTQEQEAYMRELKNILDAAASRQKLI